MLNTLIDLNLNLIFHCLYRLAFREIKRSRSIACNLNYEIWVKNRIVADQYSETVYYRNQIKKKQQPEWTVSETEKDRKPSRNTRWMWLVVIYCIFMCNSRVLGHVFTIFFLRDCHSPSTWRIFFFLMLTCCITDNWENFKADKYTEKKKKFQRCEKLFPL